MGLVGGYLPDPPSTEDKPFSLLAPHLKEAAAATLVDNEYFLPIKTPVSNQGSIGSCVANATCDALEILMGIAGLVVEQLSRLFTYYNARLAHGQQNEDSGTYIRLAFASLRKLGVCGEDKWKYDVLRYAERPDMMAYRTAAENRLDSFYRIDATGDARLDDIDKALYANHPVVFGTLVGREFVEYRGDDHVFYHPGTGVGRHAMIICGVRRVGDRRQYWVRNSWGQGWGIAGYCWLDESYIKHPDTVDLWVPTLMPVLKAV
jgi:hypothetical protein